MLCMILLKSILNIQNSIFDILLEDNLWQRRRQRGSGAGGLGGAVARVFPNISLVVPPKTILLAPYLLDSGAGTAFWNILLRLTSHLDVCVFYIR